MNNRTRLMWWVIASLAPAGIAGIYIFGAAALRVIVCALLSAGLTEALLDMAKRRPVHITDGSALLTGLLLAYTLPPQVPFWIPIIGSAVAIAVGKLSFGQCGGNIFNPALLGRVFLMVFWPGYMAMFTRPVYAWPWQHYDTIAQATPLALLKEGVPTGTISYGDLLLGLRGGSIGEVCIVALLIGAAVLLLRKIITGHIPFLYIASTALVTYIFSPRGYFHGDWLFHILSGGLILGAFFMATDYATAPGSRRGKIVFGIGCGILTASIRLWGRYPEGVCFAILFMNAVVPFINRRMKMREALPCQT